MIRQPLVSAGESPRDVREDWCGTGCVSSEYCYGICDNCYHNYCGRCIQRDNYRLIYFPTTMQLKVLMFIGTEQLKNH